MNDLQAQADKFIEKEHHDSITIKEKAETITTRYEKYGTVKWNKNSFFPKSASLKMFDLFCCHFRITNMASERRARLEKANDLQQLFRDIDDEESWIK